MIWAVYNDSFTSGKFKFIQFQLGLLQKNFELKDITQLMENSYACKTENIGVRLEKILEICKKLNIKHTEEYGHVIKREVLDGMRDYIVEHEKEIRAFFNIRDQSKKQEYDIKRIVSTLNKILDKTGFSEIKRLERKKKRLNGKEVDISDFVLKNTEQVNIASCLNPKVLQSIGKPILKTIVFVDKSEEDED